MVRRVFHFFLFIAFFVSSLSIHARETHILCLDGGGIRGIASLELLRNLQNNAGIEFHRDFDIFSGTSTGAVIAVFLACGMSVDDLLKNYMEMGSDVFSNARFIPLFHPKYNHENLKRDLENTFHACGFSKDILLRDLPKKVVIPTVNLCDEESKRWKLDFQENLSPNGGNIKVVDALLESTAAPLYFSSVQGHIDGGVGMNDPCLAALMFAYNPRESDLRNFTLLSIGTGYRQAFVEGGENWGAVQWLTGGFDEHSGLLPFLRLMLDVETQASGQVCEKLLGERYKKIDFLLPKPIGLDDYEHAEDLIEYTREFITENPSTWEEACTWVEKHFWHLSHTDHI